MPANVIAFVVSPWHNVSLVNVFVRDGLGNAVIVKLVSFPLHTNPL